MRINGLSDCRAGKFPCHATFKARFARRLRLLTRVTPIYTPDPPEIQSHPRATLTLSVRGAETPSQSSFIPAEHTVTTPRHRTRCNLPAAIRPHRSGLYLPGLKPDTPLSKRNDCVSTRSVGGVGRWEFETGKCRR